MKGQPLAYNKDNQEDKEPLFDTVDTVRDCLTIMADLAAAIEVKPERMRLAVLRGFATATDMADYLTRKGLAFRDAHEIVARAVKDAEVLGKDLAELPLDVLRGYSALMAEDVYLVLSPEGSVASRNHIGGTAPAQVRMAAQRARARLG